MDTLKELISVVDKKTMINRALSEWRDILVNECQVFVYNENYIAKRFDHIHYQFCEKEEAKEILIDNLFALLRYKYFTGKLTTEEENKIEEIVNNFTSNLKTSLKRISFESDDTFVNVEPLPNYCLAFRNGVYDFKKNDWFFRYNKIKLEKLYNEIYLYDPRYIILWYFDFDFEPLPININDTSLEEFFRLNKEVVRDMEKGEHNYCFELMYNMAHDENHKFSINKFKHLCEVMGYLCNQSLLEYFSLLIGSGGNGKDSLFGGCFSNRVIPRPATNDLFSIEEDKFITGSLENRAHNIYLESTTADKVYKESKTIKHLTGTTYHTVEKKGVNKYSSYINCKFIFAANDQDRIKFSDTTDGFTRRINVYEIFYHWDSEGRYLKVGDYYNISYSDDLREIRNDIINCVTFIYFAMYGIKEASKNFTDNFKFGFNDWKKKYFDIDYDLKELIEDVDVDRIIKYLKSSAHRDEARSLLYDINKNRLSSSSTIKEFGYKDLSGLINLLKDDESRETYFTEYDIYLSVRALQQMIGNLERPISFTQALKRIYRLNKLPLLCNNKPYVRISFKNKKLKIIKR